MSGPALGAVIACLVAAAIIAAWTWVGLVLSVYQWFLDRSALADRASSRPSSPSGEEGHDSPGLAQPHVEGGAPSPPLSSPPPASCAPSLVDGEFPRHDYMVGLPIAAAIAPDFDAFFGGLETVVAVGGVLVVALVVVMTVRRMTSF